MNPDALPLLVVTCTAPAWMLSIRSASDDLLSSERSAAPMNWMLSAGLSGGVGVLVAGGTGVLVAGGAGVLVAGGSGVLVASGSGVLVASGSGVLVGGALVLGEGGNSGDLPGSSEHPAIMPIRMIDQMTSRAAWPFMWDPLTAMGLRSLAKSRPKIRG